MEAHKVPLNTWMVIEPAASGGMKVLSTHRTQNEAEAERDKRNTGLSQKRYSAVMALQPVAERMGRFSTEIALESALAAKPCFARARWCGEVKGVSCGPTTPEGLRHGVRYLAAALTARTYDLGDLGSAERAAPHRGRRTLADPG